jgi:DnaK suppressor protein
MNDDFLQEISDQLQRERRILVEDVKDNDETFRTITEARQSEREEEAQQERDAIALETLDEQQQARLADIDAAIARIEGGSYGMCANCGKPIGEERLRAMPTTTLCAECAEHEESRAIKSGSEDIPEAGRLPPDLDQLDDDEVAAQLSDLVRDDGQVEMDELEIRVRNGVIYLEGAVPSEPEHEILLNVLTDVAGVQDIVDHLEVQRLAWERDDRSKNQASQDVTPGTIPNQEPYGGTEDVVLSEEEGVTYEPPEKPPPPPNRKD